MNEFSTDMHSKNQIKVEKRHVRAREMAWLINWPLAFVVFFLIWEQRDSTVTWHKIDCFATKRMFSRLHNIFLPKMRAKGNFNYYLEMIIHMYS